METWINMLEQQPKQGERILTQRGKVLRYDRFDYSQWHITHWRKIPQSTSCQKATTSVGPVGTT
jgi:hypothetical protein